VAQARDDGPAEEYWRRALADLTEPTPLPADRPAAARHRTRTARRCVLDLGEERSARLRRFAQQHGLTMNTIVQGAWALLLSRHSGRREVCFGATVSGRPADLPGMDAIIGIFINTLPVRVDLPEDAALADWLRAVQAAQAEARAFEHVPLTRLHSWSAMAPGVNLFDSLVVFENYPSPTRRPSATGCGCATSTPSRPRTTRSASWSPRARRSGSSWATTSTCSTRPRRRGSPGTWRRSSRASPPRRTGRWGSCRC
jgi:non-ribosomal peptide synthetase component F